LAAAGRAIVQAAKIAIVRIVKFIATCASPLIGEKGRFDQPVAKVTGLWRKRRRQSETKKIDANQTKDLKGSSISPLRS
jgi:hypothetical protein